MQQRHIYMLLLLCNTGIFEVLNHMWLNHMWLKLPSHVTQSYVAQSYVTQVVIMCDSSCHHVWLKLSSHVIQVAITCDSIICDSSCYHMWLKLSSCVWLRTSTISWKVPCYLNEGNLAVFIKYGVDHLKTYQLWQFTRRRLPFTAAASASVSESVSMSVCVSVCVVHKCKSFNNWNSKHWRNDTIYITY